MHSARLLTVLVVSALPRARASAPLQAAALPVGVLVLTLIAPALDLLGIVQHSLAMPILGLLAASVATAALLVAWLRWPRTSWLAAAGLAGLASLALRFAGAELAPLLSLLSLVAVGIGGGFASSHGDGEVFLAQG